jgi:hypothetical protein
LSLPLDAKYNCEDLSLSKDELKGQTTQQATLITSIQNRAQSHSQHRKKLRTEISSKLQLKPKAVRPDGAKVEGESDVHVCLTEREKNTQKKDLKR